MTQERITMLKSKTLHGRHACDLETPDVDKMASQAWLKAGEIFPESTGFMIAIQNLVISTNNYKKYILKDPNSTNNICRRETTPHISGACRALAQDDHTKRYSYVANIGHQELAIKCGLSKGTTNAIL
jgi:hypothetical protein